MTNLHKIKTTLQKATGLVKHATEEVCHFNSRLALATLELPETMYRRLPREARDWATNNF